MRIVVKIGTAVFADPKKNHLALLVKELALARKQGNEILLVTSGAIISGIKNLRWKARPTQTRMKQAAAAVGQVRLMQTYQKLFARYKICVAQILLTRDDFQVRSRYLNARNTILALLEMETVPIINENDTVAVEEIQFGDNDTLAALVTAKIDAQMLILLTDVDGLYRPGSGKIVPVVTKITPEIERHASKKSGSGMGTGGMFSKIQAAKIATASGATTVVANGFKAGTITAVMNGKNVGTKFLAQKFLSAKGKWILFGAKVKGDIVVDVGAERALKFSGKSLLSAGVLETRGLFNKGDVVKIISENGVEFARGIVSFPSKEIEMIKKKKSGEIRKILGTVDSSFEIVHRNSLVLLR